MSTATISIPQQELYDALSKNDLQKFRDLFSKVEHDIKHDMDYQSILSVACEKPDRGEFITECIFIGCDVNKPNSCQKRPIHFAIDSLCINNLSCLLRDPNLNVDAKYNSMTPINMLVEKISDRNFNVVYSCIKLLVKHSANVNIPNSNEIAPIIRIAESNHLNKSNKREMVKYFLENGLIHDIDSGKDEKTRSKLTQLMPDLQLPPELNEYNKIWNINRLIMCLQNSRETDFLRGVNLIALNDPSELKKVLITAIKNNLTKAVEKIFRLGVDINAILEISPDETNSDTVKRNIVDHANVCGHYNVIELLSKSPRLNCTKELVSSFVKHTKGRDEKKYVTALQSLLNHHKIDINGEDSKGLTALHYAIKYNDSNTINILLRNGAYVGITNNWGCSAFVEKPELLENRFDLSITITNNELTFCYKNLVRTESMKEKVLYEMSALDLLSNSKELKHLINHPLIMSFLSLKWKRLAPFFYIDLVFCALFTIFSVSYITFCYIDDIEGCKIKIFTLMLLSYSFIREIAQLMLSPRIYLTSFDNYLECAVIILMFIIACDLAVESHRQTIAAVTIILMACEIFVLVGTLPIRSFAVHFLMLETVAKNFLKCLFVYSIIIVAFALSFYTLFHRPLQSSINSTISRSESQSEKNDEYNKFSSVGLSMMKTIVMTIGELDASNIDFKENVTSYFIFVAFILSVTTVLANLLNGLAVNDIDSVKSEAELLFSIRRCQVLARCEKVFWNEKVCGKWTNFSFDTECQYSMKTENYKQTTGVNRVIIDGTFNISARNRDKNRNETEKRTLQQKISAIDLALGKSINEKISAAQQNDSIDKRITKIESTLQIISDHLMKNDSSKNN